MWNNIVIEVGKYRSWPNTYPFQDGYLGANIQPYHYEIELRILMAETN